jgi:hypothetical protein
VVGQLVAESSGISPFWIVGGYLALAIVPKPKAVLSVDVEIWQNFIAENLFRGMEFVRNAYNADQYVVGGRVVHIPNAGTAGGAKRNRTNLPAAIVRRGDTDVTYALDEFTTDPMLITDAEKVELSYDKIASILSDKLLLLKQLIGDWIPFKWAPANNIIRTTGGNVTAHLPSATGNRKLITVADLRAAKTYLTKKGVPFEDRFALIDSDMLDQLVSELSTTAYKDFSRAYDPLTGVIGKLEGFNITERAQVVKYTNASTPVSRDPEAVAAATDNGGVICYQKNAVEKAEGTIKFFEDKDDAQFYGDVYSALVRLGGRVRRADENGLVAIVQSAA